MSAAQKIIISIDAMGGDIGLDTTLAAVNISQNNYEDIFFILNGDEQQIKAHRLYSSLNPQKFKIFHCSQVIDMDESPASVLRHKNDSSMWRAIEQVKNANASACVSAGNTGALMASSRFILKMLPDMSRPAICATIPRRGGHLYWLDLGANVDLKPQQFYQLAIMGSELAKAVYGINNPKVGLLNIGEEEIKGNEIVKEAGKLLQNAPINYIGNVEGDDIFLNENLDVVVCDGFVGNVALKSVEGLAKFIQLTLKEEYKKNIFTKLAALLSLPVLKKLKNRIDPRMYNGASLLGLRGLVIKSHGNADAFAYTQAINVAYLASKNQVLERIQNQLSLEKK